MDEAFDLNQLTIHNRYGYAVIEEGNTGRAMLCEPTMAGPDIIAFVIVERCDDRTEAIALAMALSDMGVQPRDWRQPEPEQQPQPQQIEAG